MYMELSPQDFRRLLDLAFVGNLVLGTPDPQSPQSRAYDALTRNLFAYCPLVGLGKLSHIVDGELYPSEQYMNSGIMDKVMDYEDVMLYEILAEELARRDLEGHDVDGAENDLLMARMAEYLSEFDRTGLDTTTVEGVSDQSV